MKNYNLKDSKTAQFDTIRIFCRISTTLQFMLGFSFIQGEYLQSGPKQREIFVKRPSECGVSREIIWKLVRITIRYYRIQAQVRKVFKRWLMTEGNFEG